MLQGVYELIYACFYYTIIYNITLTTLFTSFLNIDSKQTKTLTNLGAQDKSIKSNYIHLTIFSIAGLPPFIGFFTKTTLIAFGSISSIFFFSIFLPALFSILCFYVQILRYLLKPISEEEIRSALSIEENEKLFVFLLAILCLGFSYCIHHVEEIMLFIIWLFSSK